MNQQTLARGSSQSSLPNPHVVTDHSCSGGSGRAELESVQAIGLDAGVRRIKNTHPRSRRSKQTPHLCEGHAAFLPRVPAPSRGFGGADAASLWEIFDASLHQDRATMFELFFFGGGVLSPVHRCPDQPNKRVTVCSFATLQPSFAAPLIGFGVNKSENEAIRARMPTRATRSISENALRDDAASFGAISSLI